MRSKIVQIGNSFGVRIAREMLRRAGLVAGQPIDVEVAKGRITIRPHHAELAAEARRQSLRVSSAAERDARAWESAADGEGWT